MQGIPSFEEAMLSLPAGRASCRSSCERRAAADASCPRSSCERAPDDGRGVLCLLSVALLSAVCGGSSVVENISNLYYSHNSKSSYAYL